MSWRWPGAVNLVVTIKQIAQDFGISETYLQ
jgi:AraC-like DNA-binding protein